MHNYVYNLDCGIQRNFQESQRSKLISKDKADFKLNSRVKVILALTEVTGGSMENCEVTPTRLLCVSICNTKKMF